MKKALIFLAFVGSIVALAQPNYEPMLRRYPTDNRVIYVNTNASDTAFSLTGNPYCKTVGFAFTNCPANGSIVLQPGQVFPCAGGASEDNAYFLSNTNVTVIAHGAVLQQFQFSLRTNTLTMLGGKIDWLTSCIGGGGLGPLVFMGANTSNTFLRFRDVDIQLCSDGIKNSAGGTNVSITFDNCSIYVGFQAFNNCAFASTNDGVTMNGCTIIATNAAQTFDPGASDSGTWTLNNCYISGPGSPVRLDGANVLNINGGTIISTNSSWAIVAEGTSRINIRGKPCERSVVSNVPPATIRWLDDMLVQTTADTQLGLAMRVTSNSFSLGYTNYIAIKTNVLFTDASGGAAATIRNKRWTNINETAWAVINSPGRMLSNVAPGHYNIYTDYANATVGGSNSTLFGEYKAGGSSALYATVLPQAAFNPFAVVGGITLLSTITTPVGHEIGASNAMIWVSNGIPYISSTVDGQTVITTIQQ